MGNYKWNPKTKGSGIITCIPQVGVCPNKCEDCFFQSGRSYLEPLKENLPHFPPKTLSRGRIMRINDGNDSNVLREFVEKQTKKFEHRFFNTAINKDLGAFSAPVVLTINPGKSTDKSFYKVFNPPDNLMFVRVRVNTWNLQKVIEPAVSFYAKKGVVVVLTFMAYYTSTIPQAHKQFYVWKKRTLNSYWCLTQNATDDIMSLFESNPFVYSCGVKGRFECMFCGNCVREYFNAMERLRGISKRMILEE